MEVYFNGEVLKDYQIKSFRGHNRFVWAETNDGYTLNTQELSQLTEGHTDFLEALGE